MKRTRLLWISLGILVVICAIWLTIRFSRQDSNAEVYVVERGNISSSITALGRVEPVHEWPLSTQSSGRIAILNVRPGDKVREGDLLLELDTGDYEDAVWQANQTVESRQQTLEQALAAPLAEDIEIARIRLLAATLERDRAQSDYDELVDAADSQEAVDLEKARLEYEIADQAFDRVLEGTPQDRIDALQTDLAMAQLALEQARERINQARVVAPADGTIMQVNGTVGQNVYGYNTLILLADLTQFQVIAEIDELDIATVQAGARCSIRLDALPGELVPGNIVSISPGAITSLGAVTYAARIPLASDHSLRSGMSATLDIETEAVENVLVIPRRAVKEIGPTEYVTIVEGRETRDVPVITGPSDDVLVEIRQGLSEGDRILIN